MGRPWPAATDESIYIYMCFFFSLSALLLTGCMFRLSDSFAEAMEKKTFECPDGFRSIGNFQRDSVWLKRREELENAFPC